MSLSVCSKLNYIKIKMIKFGTLSNYLFWKVKFQKLIYQVFNKSFDSLIYIIKVLKWWRRPELNRRLLKTSESYLQVYSKEIGMDHLSCEQIHAC